MKIFTTFETTLMWFRPKDKLPAYNLQLVLIKIKKYGIFEAIYLKDTDQFKCIDLFCEINEIDYWSCLPEFEQ